MDKKDVWFSAYKVRRYWSTNSTLSKFTSMDLYLLPPASLPCKYRNTPDMQYSNTDVEPVKHPFGNTMDIAGHSVSWFDDEPPNGPSTFITHYKVTCLYHQYIHISLSKISQENDTNCSW